MASEHAHKIDGAVRKLRAVMDAFDMKGTNRATMLNAINTIETLRTRPVPAATDTGLETVKRELLEAVKFFDDFPPSIQTMSNIRVVEAAHKYIEQAEELLAAERAEKERLAALIHENGTPRFNAVCERAEKAEADNAELTARVKELELQLSASKETAKIKRVEYLDLDQDHSELKADYAVSEAQLKAAKKALEPFAAVLEDYDPDWEDDDVTAVLVVGSVTHYGITLGDFRKARAVLGGKPS